MAFDGISAIDEVYLSVETPSGDVEDSPFSGKGTPDNPYEIWISDEMYMIDDKEEYLSANFILMADINMYGDWLGVEGEFTGTFDGNNHTISNVIIYGGLFECLNGATVNNLTINNPVFSNSFSGNAVGTLASKTSGNTTIEGCTIIADVTGIAPFYFGGFIGENSGDLAITRCRVTDTNFTITPSRNNLTNYVGGFVGRSSGSLSISECYCCADINVIADELPASAYDNIYAGGFIGLGKLSISNSYFDGSINCRSVSKNIHVGGIAAELHADSKISNCYVAGSLSARDTEYEKKTYVSHIANINPSSVGQSLSVSNCYYSISSISSVGGSSYMGIILNGSSEYSDKSNISCSSLSDGKQYLQSSYKGFDFVNTWYMPDGSDSMPALNSFRS